MAKIRTRNQDAGEVGEDHGSSTKEKKRKRKETLDEDLRHTVNEVNAWKTSNVNR